MRTWLRGNGVDVTSEAAPSHTSCRTRSREECQCGEMHMQLSRDASTQRANAGIKHRCRACVRLFLRRCSICILGGFNDDHIIYSNHIICSIIYFN